MHEQQEIWSKEMREKTIVWSKNRQLVRLARSEARARASDRPPVSFSLSRSLRSRGLRPVSAAPIDLLVLEAEHGAELWGKIKVFLDSDHNNSMVD